MADPARARKIADRIKVIVAEYLEFRLKDERLGFVTITDARVTGDLQHASVFYTVFGSDEERKATAEVLEANRGRIRSFVGKQIGIRLTPSLEFIADALPEGAAHLEDLVAQTRARDEELARAAANAKHAGEPDPYKKPIDRTASDAAGEPAADSASDSVSDSASDSAADEVGIDVEAR
ncbi:30S ribosome-binding factor RbfA [Intrasporangium sp.]|uniref:30S ribosome-binding factor RbfA n=1 Tax=Intrasporangium sp. TaxID=1925024 RepID=UPI00293958FC|nr:30S ribosome-binding factor RbfA [Intrasporangium sp.]MDV3222767.1 30S ribosome-binding factor RbfA [Intrasporangium sp.]